jgi:hypothetical protein
MVLAVRRRDKRRWCDWRWLAIAVAGSIGSFTAVGCARASVVGQIVTADGRTGVPCVLEMRDHRYKDGHIIMLLRAYTGEKISGQFENQPPHTDLHPISETQEMTVRCDGYAPVTRAFTVKQLWWGAPMGTITVERQTTQR